MPAPRFADRIWIDDAVARDALLRDAFNRQHRSVQPIEHVNQLFGRRRIGVDDIVRENDRERFVTDEISGDQHGVAEAKRFALPHVGEVEHVRDLADLVELVALAARFEVRLELDRDVEVIFDGVLAAAGDQNDVVGARRARFLDAVLDDRLVDQRQHLFGLSFGRREKSGAETGGGKHGFAHT